MDEEGERGAVLDCPNGMLRGMLEKILPRSSLMLIQPV